MRTKEYNPGLKNNKGDHYLCKTGILYELTPSSSFRKPKDGVYQKHPQSHSSSSYINLSFTTIFSIIAIALKTN